MILAVDIGNTHIVVGCISGDAILSLSRMTTDILKTVDEYTVELKVILEFNNINFDEFEGAIVTSVVPPLVGVFSEVVSRLTGCVPIIVGAGIKTGLNILIDNPAQLGSDLVAESVAAIACYDLPVIIIDMGTATTISVIDDKANFLGCIISPGLALSMDALASRTSQLPKIEIEPPEKCIGTNSIDSMKSGAIFGTAAMIDGMIDRIEKELGKKAQVIATGGIAYRIVPYCSHDIISDDTLILKGLNLLYKKNNKKGSK